MKRSATNPLLNTDMTDLFHIVIQGRPPGVAASPEGQLPVAGPQISLPLPVTFDDAYASLERIDQLFIEPDGAFLWTGWDKAVNPPRELWRLDGCLYDSGPSLQYVELKGHCNQATWATFCAALRADEASAMVQLVEAGEFFGVAAFAERFVE